MPLYSINRSILAPVAHYRQNRIQNTSIWDTWHNFDPNLIFQKHYIFRPALCVMRCFFYEWLRDIMTAIYGKCTVCSVCYTFPQVQYTTLAHTHSVSCIDALMYERRNSIAKALELRLSCVKPLVCWWKFVAVTGRTYERFMDSTILTSLPSHMLFVLVLFAIRR